MVLNIFMGIELLSLAISGAVVLIMAGCILHDTSRIIEGEETNYVVATLGLYLSILNLFLHILNILGIINTD
jgi:modulator of FtsH protease